MVCEERRHVTLFSVSLCGVDVYLTVHALFERDESLGFGDSGHVLYAVVEELHEVLVVVCVQFDKHGVRSRCEMTFHYFGNLA